MTTGFYDDRWYAKPAPLFFLTKMTLLMYGIFTIVDGLFQDGAP